jgi:hypothetical protein
MPTAQSILRIAYSIAQNTVQVVYKQKVIRVKIYIIIVL